MVKGCVLLPQADLYASEDVDHPGARVPLLRRRVGDQGAGGLGPLDGRSDVVRFQAGPDDRSFVLGKWSAHADQAAVRRPRNTGISQVGDRVAEGQAMELFQDCTVDGQVRSDDFQVVHSRASGLVHCRRAS